jgi:DNA-binding CsgD family transcriptional regulator
MAKVIISNPGKIFSEYEWAELVEQMELSPREGEIVRCLFADDSDKQIAMKLQISISTVRTHMNRLFRKLNISDRQELILHIFRLFRDGCRKLNCPRQR